MKVGVAAGVVDVGQEVGFRAFQLLLAGSGFFDPNLSCRLEIRLHHLVPVLWRSVPPSARAESGNNRSSDRARFLVASQSIELPEPIRMQDLRILAPALAEGGQHRGGRWIAGEVQGPQREAADLAFAKFGPGGQGVHHGSVVQRFPRSTCRCGRPPAIARNSSGDRGAAVVSTVVATSIAYVGHGIDVGASVAYQPRV